MRWSSGALAQVKTERSSQCVCGTDDALCNIGQKNIFEGGFRRLFLRECVVRDCDEPVIFFFYCFCRYLSRELIPGVVNVELWSCGGGRRCRAKRLAHGRACAQDDDSRRVADQDVQFCMSSHLCV